MFESYELRYLMTLSFVRCILVFALLCIVERIYLFLLLSLYLCSASSYELFCHVCCCFLSVFNMFNNEGKKTGILCTYMLSICIMYPRFRLWVLVIFCVRCFTIKASHCEHNCLFFFRILFRLFISLPFFGWGESREKGVRGVESLWGSFSWRNEFFFFF